MPNDHESCGQTGLLATGMTAQNPPVALLQRDHRDELRIARPARATAVRRRRCRYSALGDMHLVAAIVLGHVQRLVGMLEQQAGGAVAVGLADAGTEGHAELLVAGIEAQRSEAHADFVENASGLQDRKSTRLNSSH